MTFVQINPLENQRRALLADIVRRRPKLRSAKINKCLVTQFNRSVYRGRLHRQKVVFKLFVGNNIKRRLLDCKQELAFVYKYMNSGEFQVNQPLLCFAKEGLQVFKFVEGTPFGREIAGASKAQRQKYVTMAGNWLHHYAQPRLTTDQRLNASAWVKLQKMDFENPPFDAIPLTGAADLQLVHTLLETLEHQADDMANIKASHAAIHGDFSTRNLIYDAGVLTGVDIEGKIRCPLAQDVARFLVVLQTTFPVQSDHHSFGIAQQDFCAMEQSGVLPAQEYRQVVPFFIGVQLFKRFYHYSANQKHLAITRETVRQYIQAFG